MSTQFNSANEYILLKEKYDEKNIVFVISTDRIETLDYCDTYGRYGQVVGHENAGDYHPDNQYCDFVEGDEESLTTCKGFNYWDGSNWASVVTYCGEIDEAITHEIITDEKEIAVYLKAIEEMEFDKDAFGKKIYSSGDFKIVDSYCQGVWEKYSIIESESPYVELI